MPVRTDWTKMRRLTTVPAAGRRPVLTCLLPCAFNSRKTASSFSARSRAADALIELPESIVRLRQRRLQLDRPAQIFDRFGIALLLGEQHTQLEYPLRHAWVEHHRPLEQPFDLAASRRSPAPGRRPSTGSWRSGSARARFSDTPPRTCAAAPRSLRPARARHRTPRPGTDRAADRMAPDRQRHKTTAPHPCTRPANTAKSPAPRAAWPSAGDA